MEDIISNSIIELNTTINLLKELHNNYDNIKKLNKENLNNLITKIIYFSNSTELLKDNLLNIMDDIKNKESIINSETLEDIQEHKKVSKMIHEVLPFLLCYFMGKTSSI